MKYSLSEQSFNSASVILKRKELPGPGGLPATFKLSVVPCPCTIMASITVKLFLYAKKKEGGLETLMKGLCSLLLLQASLQNKKLYPSPERQI